MAFERVPKSWGRGEAPGHVNISATKQITLSTAYMTKFEGIDYIDVFWDPEFKMGLLKPTTEKTQDSMRAVRQRNGAIKLHATMLIKYMGIKLFPTSVPCRWDDKLGGLLVGHNVESAKLEELE